jgi:hypothetical protein
MNYLQETETTIEMKGNVMECGNQINWNIALPSYDFVNGK